MGEWFDIVTACENQLGWIPQPQKGSPGKEPSVFTARAAATRRLQTAASRQHPPATPEDVRLALAYCVRQRQPVPSPAHLLRYISVARERAVVTHTPNTLTAAVEDAVAWEQMRAEPQVSSYWITRLVRAYGGARADVLSEWKEAGRGDQDPV